MSKRRILSLALTASISMLAAPAIAQKDVSSNDDMNCTTAPLIVRGRILQETSQPIPQRPEVVVLASLWTYRVRVVQVVCGKEGRGEIVVKNRADPALRKDIDFVFALSPNTDGTYDVKSLRHAQ